MHFARVLAGFPLQANHRRDVRHRVQDVADGAVRAEHGRVHRAPVALLEAAAVRFGPADGVLLRGHHVGPPVQEDAVQRRPQVGDPRRGRVAGVVRERFEERTAE